VRERREDRTRRGSSAAMAAGTQSPPPGRQPPGRGPLCARRAGRRRQWSNAKAETPRDRKFSLRQTAPARECRRYAHVFMHNMI